VLEKALELPVPIEPKTPDERVVRLDGDIAGLIDLIADQQEQIKELQQKIEQRPLIELKIGGVPMKIEPAATTPVAAAPECRVRRRRPHKNPRFLASMPDGWITKEELANRLGKSLNAVSVALNYYKKQGRAEKNADGQWRKVVEPITAEVFQSTAQRNEENNG
jgi:hypothetical protein